MGQCRARMEKAAKFSELLEGGRCQLVVVGIETGEMEQRGGKRGDDGLGQSS